MAGSHDDLHHVRVVVRRERSQSADGIAVRWRAQSAVRGPASDQKLSAKGGHVTFVGWMGVRRYMRHGRSLNRASRNVRPFLRNTLVCDTTQTRRRQASTRYPGYLHGPRESGFRIKDLSGSILRAGQLRDSPLHGASSVPWIKSTATTHSALTKSGANPSDKSFMSNDHRSRR